MLKKLSIIIFPFCLLLNEAIAQSTLVPYRVFVELKAGLHREKNVLTDPGGRLSNRPHIQSTTGINAGVYLKNGRSTLSLELDHVTLGNSYIFDSVPSAYGSGRTFLRLSPTYTYHLHLINIKSNPKLSIFGKIGPSITFNSSPVGSTGTIETVFYDDNDDTLAFNLTQRVLNRTLFAGITLGGGILFTPNPRLRFSYSVYPSWNLTSNDVMLQDIQYRFFNDPNTKNANARSTGNTLTQSISIGYAFGKTQERKNDIEKKKNLYTAEEWDKRKRWSLTFITSNSYPVISKNDPAGYLSKKPVEKFTFGANLFYRLSKKWFLGTGFETIPYQLDARPDFVVAGNGAVIKNGIQIPLFGEYQLLQTKGRLPFELLLRGGIAAGIQRQEILNADEQYGSFTQRQPRYYNETETKDRPEAMTLSALGGLRVNWHFSKHIFLTGHAQYQASLSNKTFHRTRAFYQMVENQTPFYAAELTSKGSVFLPGFGVGFKL